MGGGAEGSCLVYSNMFYSHLKHIGQYPELECVCAFFLPFFFCLLQDSLILTHFSTGSRGTFADNCY